MFSWASRTNEAVNHWAARVDDSTGQLAGETARTLALTVRLLRWPTAALVALPVPFILATILIAVLESGIISGIAAIVAVTELVIWGFFAWRRQRILDAVSEHEPFATELGIAVAMTGHVDEARGVLTRLTTTNGFRVFDRLRAAWSGMHLGSNWISQIGDLPRAKWFLPPSIGITITSFVAMLWLVPVSALVTFFLLVAAIAN